MYNGKVVKMKGSELRQLEESLELLQEQFQFLKEQAEGDPEIRDIAEECSSAEAGLSDYLDIYRRQFVDPDQI